MNEYLILLYDTGADGISALGFAEAGVGGDGTP